MRVKKNIKKREVCFAQRVQVYIPTPPSLLLRKTHSQLTHILSTSSGRILELLPLQPRTRVRVKRERQENDLPPSAAASEFGANASKLRVPGGDSLDSSVLMERRATTLVFALVHLQQFPRTSLHPPRRGEWKEDESKLNSQQNQEPRPTSTVVSA